MFDWQLRSGDPANSSSRCAAVAAAQIEAIHNCGCSRRLYFLLYSSPSVGEESTGINAGRADLTFDENITGGWCVKLY
ncbi:MULTISPECIES: hypothetical protein [unclassified Microcoleus]|uniref:hypothetical protein n=1 Tax=unclassified Microcoleus TaxID=2642155 RepID=UPI002FD79C94